MMFWLGIVVVVLLLLIAGATILVIYNLQKELRKSRRALEKHIQGRLDMFTNLNREVRTPLNAVLGISEQLSHTPLVKEQQEMVHTIEHAAGMIMQLLNNVQDIGNLHRGEVQLAQLPFRVHDIFMEVMEEKKKAAYIKGLAFEVTFDGEPHVQVVGDAERLKQIITNLTDNAIRYTQEGRVQVQLKLEGQGVDKIMAHLIITDTGPGIADTMLPDIFQFYSAPRPPHLTVSGAGMGLAITQRILHLHGSDIRVESVPGRGSTFACSILYDVQPAPKTIVITQQELEENTGSFLEGKYVLIADDQEMNLLLLSRILTRWKCRFDKAVDGMIAYELFGQHTYDLVLLDVQMPRMTGMEVVHRIRADKDPVRAQVPVLAITSDITLYDNARYRELGFNDCLLKPFRERDIYNTIIRHLRPVGV